MDKIIKNIEDCRKLGLNNLSKATYSWFVDAFNRYQKYRQGECSIENVDYALSNFRELYTNETGIECGSVVRLGKLIFNGNDADYKGTLWTIRNILEGSCNAGTN